MFKQVIRVWLIAVVLAWMVPAAAMANSLTAYFNNFDTDPTVGSGITAGLSGVTSTEGVQGYSGIGSSDNQFSGNFLRNASIGYPTTLTLTGLPPHTSINVNFLLAIIDSWDGYTEYGPDAFNVQVDGVSVFSQVISTFYQVYNPPYGVLLSSGSNLGFDVWADNAYDMYLEPAFQNIPHTGSTLTISWFASGPVWQGGEDESWAIENVQVVLNNVVPPHMLLGFPLPGYTPFTAPVSAAMDNSVLERSPIEFYVPGEVIKAFNGEIGEKQYGVKYLDPYGLYWPAYMNSTGADFFPPSGAGGRPLNYLNGPYLSYAGNPGYNYQVPEGTPVLATADGKLYKAADDKVNGAGYDYYYNSYIDHQNGFFSWYLYAPLNPDILTQISLNGYAQVTKGQVIGKTIGDRLHFEVRHNGDDHQHVVDPYKLGLWRPKTGQLEGLLPLLLEDAPPIGD
jgi:hypothetical protein